MSDGAAAARCYVPPMATFLSIDSAARSRSAAVALVLLLGLINMMRGGSPNRSQNLMRLRVLLQFVAIVITMLDGLGDGAGDRLDDLRQSGGPMVVLNRIYTRTGDDGTTALGSGERRPKYDLRVGAYGTVDETNAAIGVVRLHLPARRDSMRCWAASRTTCSISAPTCVPEREGKAERLRDAVQPGRAAGKRDRQLQRRIGAADAPSCCREALLPRHICIWRAPFAAARNA